MESIVIYNMGRNAFKAGMGRVAPDSVMYPVRSQYHEPYDVEASLCDYMKREWLKGYDRQRDGRNSY